MKEIRKVVQKLSREQSLWQAAAPAATHKLVQKTKKLLTVHWGDLITFIAFLLSWKKGDMKMVFEECRPLCLGTIVLKKLQLSNRSHVNVAIDDVLATSGIQSPGGY